MVRTALSAVAVRRDLLGPLLRLIVMDSAQRPTDQVSKIPTTTLAWGWVGVLPFATLSLALLFGDTFIAGVARQVLVPYAAIILTFMGGVHWGLEMRGAGRGSLLYNSGIFPSLVAVAALVLPVHLALLALGVGFAGLLAFDLWMAQQGIIPRWYSKLRIQLTSAVLACLIVAGLAI
ncbi:MAG: DUF3429 domain-containing protein [Pseudomonadota bacterium]